MNGLDPYQIHVGRTIQGAVDEWRSAEEQKTEFEPIILSTPIPKRKLCDMKTKFWIEKMGEQFKPKEEEAGPLEEVESLDVEDYYCFEHYWNPYVVCEGVCGFVRPEDQLNLEEGFYSVPRDEIDWNTIEGLDSRMSKEIWRKIIMRGAGMDQKWLVCEMIGRRIRSLKWQIVNNQWFFPLGGRLFWRTPSWPEIRAKGKYYDELLHLIRHKSFDEDRYDAADKYSPYDI